jgi:hypothetical protein
MCCLVAAVVDIIVDLKVVVVDMTATVTRNVAAAGTVAFDSIVAAAGTEVVVGNVDVGKAAGVGNVVDMVADVGRVDVVDNVADVDKVMAADDNMAEVVANVDIVATDLWQNQKIFPCLEVVNK